MYLQQEQEGDRCADLKVHHDIVHTVTGAPCKIPRFRIWTHMKTRKHAEGEDSLNEGRWAVDRLAEMRGSAKYDNKAAKPAPDDMA